MGIPAWAWFLIAVVAAGAGTFLLMRDKAQLNSRNRERRRWAALRGWQFAETDPVLTAQWLGGAVANNGGGVARDVVAGSTFTSDGRRRVYVFDLDTAVVAAVQCRRAHAVVVELWLANTPFHREHMPELLGPVGRRYAFVSDLTAARSLITPDLVDATEDIGDDVPVVWIERSWVLAGAPVGANPSRLERLLRGLGEIADIIDPFDAEMDPIDSDQPGDQPGDQSRDQHGEQPSDQGAGRHSSED